MLRIKMLILQLGLVGSLFSILFFDVSAARTLCLPRRVAGRVLRISPPPANYP